MFEIHGDNNDMLIRKENQLNYKISNLIAYFAPVLKQDYNIT